MLDACGPNASGLLVLCNIHKWTWPEFWTVVGVIALPLWGWHLYH
jgi:hypothetical protein